MADDFLSALADEICQTICENVAEEASATVEDMCGNAGQEAIIGNSVDDLIDLIMNCADGQESGEWSTDHDDAVGEIVDVGNDFIGYAAAACAEVRAAAAAGSDVEGADPT